MVTASGQIVIIDLNKLFINGIQVENVLTISVNKSETLSIEVSNIDCKYKAELQALGINVKVV